MKILAYLSRLAIAILLLAGFITAGGCARTPHTIDQHSAAQLSAEQTLRDNPFDTGVLIDQHLPVPAAPLPLYRIN